MGSTTGAASSSQTIMPGRTGTLMSMIAIPAYDRVSTRPCRTEWTPPGSGATVAFESKREGRSGAIAERDRNGHLLVAAVDLERDLVSRFVPGDEVFELPGRATEVLAVHGHDDVAT